MMARNVCALRWRRFFAVALVLSLVWLLLMRYCAGIMVWVTILAFLSIFVVGTLRLGGEAPADATRQSG